MARRSSSSVRSDGLIGRHKSFLLLLSRPSKTIPEPAGKIKGSITISGGLATEDFSRRLIRPDYRLSAHPSPDTPEILMLPNCGTADLRGIAGADCRHRPDRGDRYSAGPSLVPSTAEESIMSDAVSLDVSSRETWVATPVWVQAGDRLVFRANGTWFDAIVPCSADGYPAPFFYALNLLPRIPDDGRYFRLMGRITADGQQPSSDDAAATFAIGTASELSVAAGGRLLVFANDRAGFYWNNFGSVRLSIQIVRAHPA